MKYGHFDDESREYVITNPHTPVKWINYIGTIGFGGYVDHTGGALICKGDPALNRITNYATWRPASEFKGESIYIRLVKNNSYKIITPFYVPSLQEFSKFQTHVGTGYSKIISEIEGIRTSTTIFIPLDAEVEIRDYTITNISNTPMCIDCFPVVEYTHPDALKQLTNADWVPQTMQSRMIEGNQRTTILIQYPFMFRDIKINWFSANVPAASFQTDRKRFLGNNEYGTWAHPLALEKEYLDNYEAHRGDSIGVFQIQGGTLAPGQSFRFHTILGQSSNCENATEMAARFITSDSVDREYAKIITFWDNYFEKFTSNTPDNNFNTMINIHTPHQCYITKNWSRYLSLYQLGYGARGIGFRDSSQDCLGVMDRVPEEARSFIEKLLSVQKINGSVMHQFNPLTMIGSEGDSLEREDRPKYYSDDHLWIVLAVCWYLKETGNIEFLNKQLPFYEKNAQGAALQIDTVLNHLIRAVEFTFNDRGTHKLPLLGFADWNDTVNLATGAESVFSACLFGKAVLELKELAEFLHDTFLIDKCTSYYNSMEKAFNETCWDGEWFVGYFDHDGSPIGSKCNKHGAIQINSQSWATIAGFADKTRSKAALDSVHRLLNTSKGIKLSYPGFNGFDPALGGVTTYPPGAKENGGIFLHTNPWVIIAETLNGNGNRAWEYFNQINPAGKNEIIDEYECEPYVFPQNIIGNEHPQFGLARNSWLSGTASWAYTAATKYILGIQPSYKGLNIDPCIPDTWDTFTVQRIFRGTKYSITVKNHSHVSKGVKYIVVDGEKISSSIVPLLSNDREHQVEVIMG